MRNTKCSQTFETPGISFVWYPFMNHTTLEYSSTSNKRIQFQHSHTSLLEYPTNLTAANTYSESIFTFSLASIADCQLLIHPSIEHIKLNRPKSCRRLKYVRHSISLDTTHRAALETILSVVVTYPSMHALLQCCPHPLSEVGY